MKKAFKFIAEWVSKYNFRRFFEMYAPLKFKISSSVCILWAQKYGHPSSC